MEKVIATGRLILRKWKEEDAGRLFEMASDPELAKGAGWLPHSDESYSKAIIRTVLHEDGTYAICKSDDPQKPIGSIGIHIGASKNRGIERDDEGEIGYWIGKSYQGNGYATEALSEIIRLCFVDIGLSRVWCGYFDGNEKSKRVIEKCGLKFSHRNEHLFNGLRQEYYDESMMCISASDFLRILK